MTIELWAHVGFVMMFALALGGGVIVYIRLAERLDTFIAKWEKWTINHDAERAISQETLRRLDLRTKRASRDMSKMQGQQDKVQAVLLEQHLAELAAQAARDEARAIRTVGTPRPDEQKRITELRQEQQYWLSSHLRQFDAILVEAFPTPADVTRMVAYGLDVTPATIASGSDLREMVHKLIEWAKSRDRLPDLLAAACEANPDNARLRTFASGDPAISGRLKVPLPRPYEQEEVP